MSKLYAFHTNIEELFSLSLNEKVHIYVKDLNSRYLEVNMMQAMFYGYTSPRECCQKNLRDSPYRTRCDSVIADDQAVMRSKTTMLFIEQVIQKIYQNTFVRNFLSVKTPIFNQHQYFKGLFGLSFYLSETNLPAIFKILNDLQLFADPNSKSLCQWDKLLTLREKDCAYFLAKGFSAKEIGNQLNISPRTVEKHAEKIKSKLNCFSRQQLIKKISLPL